MIGKTETKIIQLKPLVGLELDKGEHSRPIGSFQDLENFDLVREGAIRKIRGIKAVSDLNTLGVTVDPVLAIADYRRSTTDSLIVVGIGEAGSVYQLLPTPMCLYTGAGSYTGLPWLASLPNEESGLEKYFLAVIRRGVQPQKVTINPGDTSTVPVSMGCSNPRNDWSSAYQHGLLCPVLGASRGTDESAGVELRKARRYRWTYYNPTTKRDSSPSPLIYSLNDLQSEPGMEDTQQSPGIAFGSDSTPYLEQVILYFNGTTKGANLPAPTIGDGAYTKIRLWATQDNGSTFYLLPRVYDDDGVLLTDDEGAIPLSGLLTSEPGETAIKGAVDPLNLEPLVTRLYDGYAAEGDDSWIVDGGSQTGGTLVVKDGEFQPADQLSAPCFKFERNGRWWTHADRFTIDGDATVYTIVDSGAVTTWSITPNLAVSPANGAKIRFFRRLPVVDSELIVAWEGDEYENDPPPKARWGIVYQQRLWLVNDDDPTKLHFSTPGRYEEFPKNNVFNFPEGDLSEIVSLISSQHLGLASEGVNQRLLVAKEKSIFQLLGSNTDYTQGDAFVIRPYLPATGIIGPRAWAVVNGILYGITRRGIEILDVPRSIHVGAKVRTMIPGEGGGNYPFYSGYPYANTQLLADTQRGQGIVVYGISSAGNSRLLLIADIMRLQEGVSPFSNVKQLGSGISSGILYFTHLYESAYYEETTVTEQPALLAMGLDNQLYTLFDKTSGLSRDPSSTVLLGEEFLSATARTQLLPQDDPITLKVFSIMWVKSDDVYYIDQQYTVDSGWQVRYSIDEGTSWTGWVQMYEKNYVGLIGKHLLVELRHNRKVATGERQPMISDIVIEYSVLGRSGNAVS